MKRLLFVLILALFTSFAAFSQTEPTRIRSNELGLDVFDLALFRTIDLSYEYVKNADIGFGLTGRYCFDNRNEAFNKEKYAITPFFRYYFFNKQDYGSKGFYAESFLKFFGGEDYVYNFTTDTGADKDFFEAAFGVGVGFKYVSYRGFVLDLNIGGGRSFGLSNISPEVTGRASILFGYRF